MEKTIVDLEKNTISKVPLDEDEEKKFQQDKANYEAQQAEREVLAQRNKDIKNEQQSSGMKKDTVQTAQDKISDIFDAIRSMPTDTEKLDALINKCESIFKKISVELLEQVENI